LLSRLHRKAEALDQACLRAQGHPNDYAIRQELLSALEWEATLRPDHARPAIRETFEEVHEKATALSGVLRSSPVTADPAAAPISPFLPGLRRSLAALMQVLATARHGAPPAGPA
jgi:hypothetical protein